MNDAMLNVLKLMSGGEVLTHSRTDGWWVGFKKMPLGSACRVLVEEGYLERGNSDAEEYVLTDKGRAQLST